MIKGIIVDFGGVLFSNGTRITLHKLENRISHRKLREIVVGDLGWAYRFGRLTKKQFWSKAGKILGDKRDTELLRNTWLISYKLRKDVWDMLVGLKQGCKIAALSNTIRERIAYLEKTYNFRRLFDAEVYSYNLGTAKPDEVVFREVLRRLGLGAGECVFIDDNERSLVGARKSGMKCILFKNLGQVKGELKKLGVRI